MFISLQMVIFLYSKDIKKNWDNFDNIVETKMSLLSEINNDFGYGGAIHSYKNYLIRGEDKYLVTFNIKYDEFIKHKNEYLNLRNVSLFEMDNIREIESVFYEYKVNINKINDLLLASKSARYIDSQVRIDDSVALKAIKNLNMYFINIRHNTTKDMHNTINKIYNISLLVIFLIVILIGIVSMFFEKIILKPLRQIEEGLISFFKFLSNEKNNIEPIKIKKNDEFGLMAKSINKNILLATNMHNDITVKNSELHSLICSYGQNVIASKTDLDGVITYVSQAFENICGYTKDEILGKTHNIVRHPDTPNSVFNELWTTIKSGHIWVGEIKNKKKNGEYYLVRATVSPLYDEYENHIGYSSIREDITDSKEVEVLNEQLDVYKNHLETKVKKSTDQIQDLLVEIEDTQKEVVFTMGAIGERRSEETGNHVKRVAEYSKLFALYCGIDEKEAELLKQASPMHDIGKVGISDAILNKKGKLTQEEHVSMQEHAVLGYNMLKSSHRPLLQTAAIVANEHHEKYDGTGYPQGLVGEEIHIYGRITAIADVFDALGSDRIYKKAWSDEKIFKLFKEERGNHFDPNLVDIFFENLDEFILIRSQFPN